jgi:hypothetical protein
MYLGQIFASPFVSNRAKVEICNVVRSSLHPPQSLHTGEVVGSIHTPPTTKSPDFSDISCCASSVISASDGRTKHEDGGSTRGKSMDSVREMLAGIVLGC